VRRDQRDIRLVDQATKLLRPEELEEEQVIPLPNREAISIVNGGIMLPIGTAASAGLLSAPQG